MDNLAHTVDIVEANQALLGQPSHEWQWHTLIVVSFDDFEEVYSQNLKDHDEVFAVGSMVDKRVQ